MLPDHYCAHTLNQVRGSAGVSGSSAVLVPVKSFSKAKLRLAEQLTPSQRSSLAQKMAETVIAAASPLPTFVVCEDDATQQWAVDLGVSVMRVDREGLNESITEAVRCLCETDTSYTHAIIAHGDLPRAVSFDGLVVPDGVLIVPDRHLDGTNVMSLPLRTDFQFHYGIGSLHAHIGEGLRLGMDVTVQRVPELEHDVDTTDDLTSVSYLLTNQENQTT